MEKTAFIFPGQASQYVGMGLDFYNLKPTAQHFYDYANQIFDFSVKDFSFYGPLSELTKTKVTQPAIFIHSLIVFEELKARNLKPDMVAGHSLGEYSALVAAGVLDFEQGLQLVKVRSEAMQLATETNSGTMAAVVGLDYDMIQEIVENSQFTGVCNIANYNAPNQIIISGDTHTVQSLMLNLKEAGAKRVIELSVGGAFHSELMKSASTQLKQSLDGLKFNKPCCPIYSNVTGTASTDSQTIRECLYRQLTNPVLWTTTIENMIKDGATRFLEVGPGTVLQGLVKRINNEVSLAGVSNVAELENLKWN
jgi:[acyl-carrier-protein] S-malonyltransferase